MRWLLRRWLSDEDRRAIESELAELYEIRRANDGERAARRWLRRQRAMAVLHLARDRFRPLSDDEQSRGGVMSGFWRDVIYSLRSLRR